MAQFRHGRGESECHVCDVCALVTADGGPVATKKPDLLLAQGGCRVRVVE